METAFQYCLAAAWQAFCIFFSIVSLRPFFSPVEIQQGETLSYQLVQVPSTDGQVALVVIHALAEVLHIRLAGRVLPGVAALVQVVVHRLGLGSRSLLGLGRGAAGATGEEAADGVADGGTNCNTTADLLAYVLRQRS